MANEWSRGDFIISDDRARLDIDVIHNFLRTAYWAGPHLPRDIVERSIANSLTFGVYYTSGPSHEPGSQPPSAVGAEGPAQIGGARVITDYATFAYVADVFVLEDHRGHGLGVWLMECIAAHPELQNLRRWMLGTRDAHTLYEKSGWVRIGPEDDRWMERADPGVYERLSQEGRS